MRLRSFNVQSASPGKHRGLPPRHLTDTDDKRVELRSDSVLVFTRPDGRGTLEVECERRENGKGWVAVRPFELAPGEHFHIEVRLVDHGDETYMMGILIPAEPHSSGPDDPGATGGWTAQEQGGLGGPPG